MSMIEKCLSILSERNTERFIEALRCAEENDMLPNLDSIVDIMEKTQKEFIDSLRLILSHDSNSRKEDL